MTRITADWLRQPAPRTVAHMLTDAGFQAWFVGGCVRDALIGVPVADIDVATDAHPSAVMALAKAAKLRTVPTGIDHGTVTVVHDAMPIEVTTFRRDVATDGRRAVVAFATTITEDAQRRDFTINALYAAADGTVCDPWNGLADLGAGRVRFIQDASKRIREDYLRILRFFRFSAWYAGPKAGLDPTGLAACAAHIGGLAQLARERVGAEMRKLLTAPDPTAALTAMAQTGVLAAILPGADVGHIANLVGIERSLKIPAAPLRRLVALGGDHVANALRLSRKEAKQLTQMCSAASAPMQAGELGYRLGIDDALSVLALRAAATGRDIDPVDIEQAQHGAGQVFPVRARHLMPSLQGPALGRALGTLEVKWIASGFALSKQELLN